ncbi:MAG: inner membrane CreD family protein, partial [Candidatus Omnitrophica bacterium]|nr:inner membrane CreD family protein [Candidatus Omnitrophota bacterium]
MSIQNEISFLERFTRSSVVAVLILGFLVLILQIPILMIYGVIQERTGTRNEAIREVVSRWGDHQSITGPRLVVPYQCRIERDEKDKKPIIETRLAHFLPANLKISAQMDSEVRYRGIFEVPIYTMTATIEGSFMQPDFNGWEIALEDILWERAFLSVGISDTSGISGHATLDWKGSPV